MAVALIVAAGRGERLGTGRPKALRAVAGVQRIVVALPAGELTAAPEGTIAVPGGEARSHSVREALRAAGDGDPVIVHDAARPLSRPELFSRVLEELESSGADAVITAARVSDTIKEVGADGRTVARTLDRSRLWAVQTPQVFRRAALERALSGASDELLAAATDDAWLIERAGGVVRVTEAGADNLKVTTPADLAIAERLLASRARLD
jgi:2-C-methyl-D-erythritol 4-phosphate cytidylyltransferase